MFRFAPIILILLRMDVSLVNVAGLSEKLTLLSRFRMGLTSFSSGSLWKVFVMFGPRWNGERARWNDRFDGYFSYRGTTIKWIHHDVRYYRYWGMRTRNEFSRAVCFIFFLYLEMKEWSKPMRMANMLLFTIVFVEIFSSTHSVIVIQLNRF